MALNALGLGFVFTAQDLASGKINGIARSFGNMDNAAIRSSNTMQRNFAQLGAGAVVLGAGVATLAGGFALANASSSFSQELARVGGVAQASAAELEQMHAAAIRFGTTTQFAPEQAVQGLGELAQGGMNAAQSIQALDGVMNLAAGGQIEVAQAAASVSAALHVFRLDADQAGMVADQFLRITNATALAAGDMEQAMGSVARGAIATGQSITEMLPAIGLVKNTGVDVSVAAQSVSSALVFMSSHASAFEDIGVHITNADGSFRDFMDIVHDTSGVLNRDYPNAAERSAKATELFSRFGLQAYTGVSQQLAQGVRDSTGHLYQNADAIEFLRGQMTGAGGAAAEFTARLNDTYAGQRAMLTASTSALAVVLGEGFEGALKPVISMVNRAVVAITNVFDSMPIGLRTTIAQFVLWGGVIATTFGAFIAGKAILALLAPFIGSITAAFFGLLVSLIPVALTFGAILAVGYAVNRWIGSSVGRVIAWNQAWAQLKYGVLGFFQLISTGRLSGSTLEMLNQPFMAGTKRLLVVIVSFGFRIMQFFRGIRIGFNAAIDAMHPALDRASAAFGRLWSYVSSIFGDGSSLVAGGSMRYITAGAAIGDVFGGIVEVIVNVGTAVANTITGIIGGFRTVWAFFTPTINRATQEFGKLWDSIVNIGTELGIVGDTAGNSGSFFETFGNIIGGVAGGALALLVDGLRITARVIRFIIEGTMWGVHKIVQLFDFFGDLGVSIAQTMMNIKFGVLDLVDTAIVKLGELMSAIPPSIRPQLANDTIAAGIGASARIGARAVQRTQIGAIANNLRNDVNVGGPSNAAARQTAQGSQAQVAAITGAMQLLARQSRERAAQATQPINVNLVADGQVLASVTANANSNTRERSFTTTDGEGEE